MVTVKVVNPKHRPLEARNAPVTASSHCMYQSHPYLSWMAHLDPHVQPLAPTFEHKLG